MTSSIHPLQSLPGTLSISSTAAPDATRRTVSQQAEASASQPVPQAADQANVSQLGALVAQASAAPDVRLDKVAALQQAIAAGTYNVPASAVAGKIIDSLLS